MEDAPETPAPAQPARHEQEDEKVQQAEALLLQELRKPPDEKPADPLFSSDSDNVLIMDTEKTEPESLAPPTCSHELKGGQAVRVPPAPPAPPTRQSTPRGGQDTPRADIEEGTNHWMRKNGVPRRVRGDRAKEISKGLTQILRHAAPRLNIAMGENGFVDMGALLRGFWRQWVTEEEIIDVIHHNHKSRFEVRPEDGALQGHHQSRQR